MATVYSSISLHITPQASLGSAPRVAAVSLRASPRMSVGAITYGMLVVQQGPLEFAVVVSPQLGSPVVFSVSGPGDPVVLGYTVQLDGSYLVTILGGIPLEAYTLTAGDGVSTVSAAFVWASEGEPNGYKILEALTYAFGKQVQEIAGAPCTRIINNLEPFDTIVQVTSTLGFPRIGWIRIGAMLVEYVSKTSQSFTLRTPLLRYPVITAGTRVLLAVELITPDGAGVGTEGYGA